MAKGIDASVDCSGAAACLAENGYTFVGRYLGRHAADLTAAEVKALTDAGLFIVSLIENGSPTSVDFFTTQQGQSDATFAFARAHALGQPIDAPLYFAVDFDASLDDVQGAISQYFSAVSAELQSLAGAGQPMYPVGVYGSGQTCQWLLNNHQVLFAWLAESTGWAGFDTFVDWNIKQFASNGPVCGLSVDGNTSRGLGGGWRG
jgi:hypothetical protein